MTINVNGVTIMQGFLACCVFKYWVCYTNPTWRAIIEDIGPRNISRLLRDLVVELAQRSDVLLMVPPLCFKRPVVSALDVAPGLKDVFLEPLDRRLNPSSNAYHWDDEVNSMVMEDFFARYGGDLEAILNTHVAVREP